MMYREFGRTIHQLVDVIFVTILTFNYMRSILEFQFKENDVYYNAIVTGPTAREFVYKLKPGELFSFAALPKDTYWEVVPGESIMNPLHPEHSQFNRHLERIEEEKEEEIRYTLPPKKDKITLVEEKFRMPMPKAKPESYPKPEPKLEPNRSVKTTLKKRPVIVEVIRKPKKIQGVEITVVPAKTNDYHHGRYTTTGYKYLRNGDLTGDMCKRCGREMYIDKSSTKKDEFGNLKRCWAIRCGCGHSVKFESNYKNKSAFK